MSRRIVGGLVLLFVSLCGFTAAAVACVSMGLYADATGTSGYVPPVAWVTGIGAVVSLIAGVVILNGRRRRESN